MSSAALAGGPPLDAAPRPTGAAPRLLQPVRPSRREGVERIALPLRTFALASALLVHALALMWIMLSPLQPSLDTEVFIQASLIAPEPLPMAQPEPVRELPRVEPEPPKPVRKPLPRPEKVALPQLAAASDAPSAVSVAPQEPAPPEPVAIDAVSTPTAAAVAPVAAVAEPPPVNPPRFDVAYLQNPKPAYPSMSNRLGEEGTVMLWVMVEADGTPSKVDIRKSSGFPRLDQAALEAVRKWKFVPARRGTEALAAAVFVPLSFALPR